MKQRHLTRILSAALAMLMFVVSIPATTITALSSGDGVNAVTDGTDTQGNSANGNTQASQNTNTGAASSQSYVEFANSLANGVNAYFDDANRDHFYVTNQNMTLEYNLGALDDKQIGYIKNTQGVSYLEEAMDVYVKTDGHKYYAKDSIVKSGTNMDMFGYYYYQVNFEDQQFVTEFIEDDAGSVKTATNLHDAFKNSEQMTVEKNTENVTVYDFYGNAVRTLGNTKIIKATFDVDANDPKLRINGAVTNGATNYDYLKITMRSGTKGTMGSRNVQIFYWTTKNPGDTEKGSRTIAFNDDGEFHDYYFYLGDNTALFDGDYNGARLDFTGKAGETIEIASIELVNSAVSNNPDQLLLKRFFGVFSDKMNHGVQITTKKHTYNIDEIGVETRLPISDISKLIVKDASGIHTTIDGIDWNTAEYAAFDTPAGIFGYILHNDGKGDKLTVTQEGSEYVITQTNTPVGTYREYNAAVNLTKIMGVTVTFEDGSTVTSLKYDSSEKLIPAEQDVYTANMKTAISGISAEKMQTATKITFHKDNGYNSAGNLTKTDHVLQLAPYVHPYANGDATLSQGVEALSLSDTTLNVRYSYQIVDEQIRDISKITVLEDRTTDVDGAIFTSSYYSRLTASETLFYDRYLTHPGISSNENDFYMSQRLYTDESHTFDAFLVEAEIERNPLPDDAFTIYSEESTLEKNSKKGGSDGVIGYDPWTGAYFLELDGEGFNNPQYLYPNRLFNLKFSVTSPDDRNIYVFAYVENGGCLECAAILDENNMMLPIPLEVEKNFSEGGGERDIFNVEDYTYSYTIFPINLKAEETTTLNLINIQQNWGNFPNKQISSIQFHCPYYHLSTGTTESNCIVPWYTTERSRGLTTLPDHRGWSGPFWQSQPQHNSCGSHRWLTYTNSEGKYCASETTSTSVGSYGPIYADLNMDYITDDGAFRVHYNHMEMPQQDENRGYYEMQYTVLHDVTFTNMKSDFEFLSFTDNDSTGVYKRIGYLGTDGKSQYTRNNYINYAGDVGSEDELTPIYAARKLNPAWVAGTATSATKYVKSDGTFTSYANQAEIIPTEVTVAVVGDELVYTPVEANCELAKNGKGYTFYNVNTDKFAYYTLGTDHPYFSFFDMDNNSSTVNSNADGKRDGYGNLAFIVKDYSINFQNYSEAPAFAIKNGNNRVALTLDAETITLKAGDTITINAIVMPWGSQEMETYEEYWANDNNDATVDWDYEDVVNDNGELYLDKNVRDVRLDSCINYYKATSTTDTVLDSPFLAEIVSKDGKSATFTLSGGNNHMAVRAYGFDMLTVPKIYELVDGEWVVYEVSSLNKPDDFYYGYAFDGYGVYYDKDAQGNVTYSYAFIADMTDVKSRTFKVVADEEFTGWDKLQVDRHLNLSWKNLALINGMSEKTGIATGGCNVVEENGEEFVRIFANGTSSESFFTLENTTSVESGQYMLFKYRLPTTNSKNTSSFQIYTTTGTQGATDKAGIKNSFSIDATQDGEWHVAVVDMSKYNTSTQYEGCPQGAFFAVDGKYTVSFVRLDFFNSQYTKDDYIDLGIIAFTDDIAEVASFCNSDVDYFSFFDNYKNTNSTQQEIKINIIDGNMVFIPELLAQKLNYSKAVDGTTITYVTATEEIDKSYDNMPYAHLAVGDTKTPGDVYKFLFDSGLSSQRTGRYVGILYRTNSTSGITVYLDTDTSVSNYKTLSPSATGEWTFGIVDLGSAEYVDENGLYTFRLDYLESRQNVYLDLAFVALFDSLDAAYRYYGVYDARYLGNAHTHQYGDWQIHGVGETVDTRVCNICGDVEERDAVHVAGGDWIHGKTEDTQKCIYCEAVVATKDAVHTAGNEWVHGKTQDVKYCTECGEIAETRAAVHTYSAWAHVQGEQKEQRVCDCGAVETRNTAYTGWMSLADRRDRNGDDTVDYHDHLRNSVSGICRTVSAASYPIAYSESKGGYYLDINGEWLAINDGVNKYVYRIGDGEWTDFAVQSTKTNAWSESYHSAINSANVDIDRSYYHGTVPSNTVLFNDYIDQTVSLTIGIVPEGNLDIVISLITYTDIKGPDSYTEGLQFTSDGSGYTVTGYTGNETAVKIPSTYRGLSVNAIADGAFKNSEIISISIPASVTAIGSKIFEGCTALTTVTVDEGNTAYYSEGNSIIKTDDKTLIAGTAAGKIPEGVVTVAAGAFAGTGATKIDIPASVTSLDLTAFEGCEISEITVAEGNSVYGAENNCLMTGTTVILGCKNSVIPDSTTVIASGAFKNCTFDSIVLPISLTAIEAGAFEGCEIASVRYTGSSGDWKKIAVADDFNYTVKFDVVTVGDVNLDGKIDGDDIDEIRKYIASKNPTTGVASYEIYIAAADLNEDGVVNTIDLVRIKKLVAAQQ